MMTGERIGRVRRAGTRIDLHLDAMKCYRREQQAPAIVFRRDIIHRVLVYQQERMDAPSR